MAKVNWWGIAGMGFFGLCMAFAVFLPISNGSKIAIFVLSFIGLLISCNGWLTARMFVVQPVEFDLRFSVLGFDYDRENAQFTAHVVFRNRGIRQRTVISVNFIYWDPDRLWKNSYEILHSSPSASMVLGDVQPISINPESEHVTTYYQVVALRHLQQVGAQFGLQINVSDPNGTTQTKECVVIKITSVDGKGGIGYNGLGVEGLSLEET